MNDKLQSALEYLGKNWVLHPEYSQIANQHHSLKNKQANSLAPLAMQARLAGRLQ